MSCDNSIVKKRCVEVDDIQSEARTGVTPSESTSSVNAPAKSFRDLIFSVSGTMPAASAKESQAGQNTDEVCRKRKRGPNFDNSAADDNTEGNPENPAAIVNESDVGITEFMSEHAGFSGILKQRCNTGFLG